METCDPSDVDGMTKGAFIMTAPRIWIVVADGETARIYSALGRTARLEQALP
jgi:hypothetical protein